MPIMVIERSTFAATNAAPNLSLIQRYLAPAESVEAPAGTIWTCPMHPRFGRITQGLARSAVWRLSRRK
jgi:hypothetical protein